MNGLRIEHSLALQADCHRWARMLVVMTFLKARTIESLHLEHVEGVSVVGITESIVSFSTSGDETFGESSALEAWGNDFCDVGICAYALVAIFSLMMLLVIELHWSEEWAKWFSWDTWGRCTIASVSVMKPKQLLIVASTPEKIDCGILRSVTS